jgi:hypothetical protein
MNPPEVSPARFTRPSFHDHSRNLPADLLGDGFSVRDLLGQDVPDDDQQLAGDRYDRLRSADADGQTFKHLLPLGMAIDCSPGGFDHGRADVSPTLLGNSTTIVLFA